MAGEVDWLERVVNVRRWTRGGERAPHKQLLLLYCLGRLQRTDTSKVAYTEAEPVLDELLCEFGPAGRTTSPAYPFHHLQTDELWTVTTASGIDAGSSRTALRASDAVGRLAPDFEAALRSDPRLFVLIVHFPARPKFS